MGAYRYSSFFGSILRKEVVAAGWTRCLWCGGDINKRQFSVEHVIPRAAGGNDDPGNLAAAHARCNSRRGTSQVRPSATVLEWAISSEVLDSRAETYLLSATDEMQFEPPL
jgi:hypothetical protein